MLGGMDLHFPLGGRRSVRRWLGRWEGDDGGMWTETDGYEGHGSVLRSLEDVDEERSVRG